MIMMKKLRALGLALRGRRRRSGDLPEHQVRKRARRHKEDNLRDVGERMTFWGGNAGG
jgi:hypothetical protein